MGGLFSKSYTTSPKAADTKIILDKILQEMFKRADFVDLYSLADPQKCKSYIVVAADALDKLFVEINLSPKLGEKGMFYFQKIDGIQRANPDPSKQIESCKLLAFFFIRIFQIFAALTLSVFDAEIPNIDPQEVGAAAKGKLEAQKAIFIQPPTLQGFQRQQTQQQPGVLSRLFSGKGGALNPSPGNTFYLNPQRAGEYRILNRYLYAPPGGVQSTEPLRLGSNIEIPQSSLYNLTAGRQVKDLITRGPDFVAPLITCMLTNVYNERVLLYGSLLVERPNPTTIKVTLMNVNPSTNNKKVVKQVTGVLIDRYPDSSVEPLTTDTPAKAFPALVEGLFEKAYTSLYADQFSPVKNFLEKFGLITDLYKSGANIKNSKVYINGVANDMVKNAVIPVTYVDRIKMGAEEGSSSGGKTTDIRIGANLVIQREHRLNSSEYQKYTVRLDFRSLTTTPSSLKSYLDYKTSYSRAFTTGQYDTGEPKSDKDETVGQYIQKVFTAILKPAVEGGPISRGGIHYTREGLPKPYNSDSIPEDLRVLKIWEGLAKKPPVKAHCVARAIQLLNVAAIRGDMSSEKFSSICNLKFPYVQDGSLPKPGSSITGEVGIYALSKLYTEQVLGSMPQLIKTSKMAEFIQKFKGFFEKYEAVKTEVKSVKDIDEDLPPLCKGKEGGKIIVSKSVAGVLRKSALDLLAQQEKHLRSVMYVLFKLFDERDIRQNGRLSMHPNVMAGGIHYLNTVADEARDLLSDYYGACEQTYKKGVYYLIQQSKSGKEVQMPTAAAATAAVPSAAAAAPQQLNDDTNDDNVGGSE